MGTIYEVQEIDFKIPTEQVKEAIALLRRTVRERANNYREQYPDWPEYPTSLEELLRIEDDNVFLQRIADLEGWDTKIRENGIVNPYLESRKGGIDVDWMDAMHPFVVSGSYVQIFCTGDNSTYRQVWKDGKEARRVYPVWPEPED